MVLVTGATGILGRVIVLELLKRGKIVRAAKRKSSNLDEVRHSFQFYTENPDDFFNKIEWINVDFEDIDSLKLALDGVQEVYHCAAKVSFHPKDSREMHHTNIEGTKNLLYACENSSVQKFLFVSSMAVFDGVNEDGVVDENSDFNPKFDHSDYAVSKHFSEMEVWRAAAEGLNVTIINPGIIIGSGNWNSSSGELFESLRKYPFAMSGTAAYVDVRDVAKIAVDLLKKNIFNEKFILISENKKFADMANLVREKLGIGPVKILSKSVLKLGYAGNLLFGWAFPPLRMINKVNLESVTSNNLVSNQKIKEKLDYQFIPVTESVDFHLKNYIKDRRPKPGA